MPILLSCDRRAFLKTAGAAVFLATRRGIAREQRVDPSLVYVLNDTHIGENHPPDSPVPTHLRQAVTEILELSRQPACVLINGDLALKDGQLGDYRHFAKLIRPLREAGVSVHLTMGNHDNREAFYEVLREDRPERFVVQAKHIAVVETEYVNLFLLDSLTQTMVTPGTLGEAQRQWLRQALDARPDKPAVLVAHHNPRLGGDPVHFPGGLIDSKELWDLCVERAHVKAYVHGHIHDRSLAEHQGIHIVNTPATSYVADPRKSTTGWTVAQFERAGVRLTTRCTDAEHPWHGQVRSLTWRQG